eukprot:488169-Amphidinium_carterae.2
MAHKIVFSFPQLDKVAVLVAAMKPPTMLKGFSSDNSVVSRPRGVKTVTTHHGPGPQETVPEVGDARPSA